MYRSILINRADKERDQVAKVKVSLNNMLIEFLTLSKSAIKRSFNKTSLLERAGADHQLNP